MQLVNSERAAIQQAMNYIEKQQERLQNDYMALLDRQRELDNIERAYQPEVKDVPKEVPLADIIKKHNEMQGIDTDTVKQTAVATAFTGAGKEQYRSDMERLKDYDRSKRPVKNDPKKSKYRDMQRIADEMRAVLKEAAVPLKAKELIKRMNERGVEMTSNPHSTLYQAEKLDNKIEKATFGYYQYRG